MHSIPPPETRSDAEFQGDGRRTVPAKPTTRPAISGGWTAGQWPTARAAITVNSGIVAFRIAAVDKFTCISVRANSRFADSEDQCRGEEF
jgi:hypothetical protein